VPGFPLAALGPILAPVLEIDRVDMVSVKFFKSAAQAIIRNKSSLTGLRRGARRVFA
jgi:hypothetical protein